MKVYSLYNLCLWCSLVISVAGILIVASDDPLWWTGLVFAAVAAVGFLAVRVIWARYQDDSINEFLNDEGTDR